MNESIFRIVKNKKNRNGLKIGISVGIAKGVNG